MEQAVKTVMSRLNNTNMDPDATEMDFYVSAMKALQAANLPFLVGGAYAFAQYSGIARHTKDFDIFVKKEQAEDVLRELERSCGCMVDQTFHWLYKAYLGENFIDVIFSAGNNVAVVDDGWFTRAVDAVVMGVNCKVIPAEEMIWSKGFLMERERFDGADVAHIIREWGKNMDWEHLIKRFGVHWRVLFSHVLLFGYIYPDDMEAIPNWVVESFSRKSVEEQTQKKKDDDTNKLKSSQNSGEESDADDDLFVNPNHRVAEDSSDDEDDDDED